jgi:hypothetical protein
VPKVDKLFKEEIALLPKNELINLIIKAASISKQFHEYVIINHIDKVSGEKELYESAKQDLEWLLRKSYKGISEELQLANMLAACNKRINEFAKVSKDKSLEMDLIIFILEKPFSLSTKHFATCFTRYNQQVYLLVKKALALLKTKLHEDYHIQFATTINSYLTVLHRSSGHLDYIYALPKSI